MARYKFNLNTNLTLSECFNELQKLVPNFTKKDFAGFLNKTKQNIGQRMNKGSMLNADEFELLQAALERNNIPSKFLDIAVMPKEKSFINIPIRSEVELSCGYGTNSNADFVTDTFAFDINYIKKLGGNPKTVSIVFARGDSMCDRIESGDALIIDESKTYIKDGLIYAFIYDAELYCKQIQRA